MPKRQPIKPQPRIGVVIYTHGRTDDARINLEIIRSLWEKSGLFGKITIVHVFNGRRSWWPKKYLEDSLIRRKNLGHFAGAADMMDAGMKQLLTGHSIDSIIMLAADTWLYTPAVVRSIIDRMERRSAVWATSAWGRPGHNDIADVGCAMDAAMFNHAWIQRYRMFPLRYADFADKYRDFFFYQKGAMVSVEKLALGRYLEAFQRSSPLADVHLRGRAFERILRLTKREPVHVNARWHRKMHWPALGLLTAHNPKQKRAMLKKRRLNPGPTAARLVTSRSLAWYNGGRAS